MFLGTTELITLDIADQIFGMRIVLDGVTAHEKSSQGIFRPQVHSMSANSLAETRDTGAR